MNECRGVGVSPAKFLNNVVAGGTPTPRCCAIAFVFLVAIFSTTAIAMDVAPLRDLPVLDNGRVKPLDTQARQAIRAVTGRESFNGIDPVELMLRWQASPDLWAGRPVIYVPNLAVREKLGIGDAQFISPADLKNKADFTQSIAALKAKEQQAKSIGEEVAFDKTESAAMEVDHRSQMFDAMCDGRAMAIVPLDADDWLRVDELGKVDPTLPDTSAVKSAWAGVLSAVSTNNDAVFSESATRLKSTINTLKPDYAKATPLGREVAYNHVHPFRWTWILYALSLPPLIGAAMIKRRWATRIALPLFAVALLAHAGSFAWRCSLTGWAPVTNMYETVVWVSLMAAVFSCGIAIAYRSINVAIAGATAAVLGGVIADVMPPGLGRDIGNLTPVLRSNYWLTIHVLTIVSSYAAFVLAMVLGNAALWQFVSQAKCGVGVPPAANPEVVAGGTPTPRLQTTLTFTYRAIQIGVLLIAAGTILGGLWADQSWGRFWGWDPKEVWALITLLTYLALLHGRFAGWIGPFGLAAGAVLCFATVLMSWYGVNFVLGVGLHSYGFGVGGQGYVGTFVLLQILYVVVARSLCRRRGLDQRPVASNALPEIASASPL